MLYIYCNNCSLAQQVNHLTSDHFFLKTAYECKTKASNVIATVDKNHDTFLLFSGAFFFSRDCETVKVNACNYLNYNFQIKKCK